MTLFDTDILIWIQRGNAGAARLVDRADGRAVSVLTYMELLQCAQNRKQHAHTRSFLKDLEFSVLPLTENIGHRALVYVETYALSSGLRAGDAIIAATAVEHDLALSSGNARHFGPIKDLNLQVFRPRRGTE